jgi:hypothetical protein
MDAALPIAEVMSGEADRIARRNIRFSNESRGGALATGATSSVPTPLASAATADQEALGRSPVPPTARQLGLTAGPGAKGKGKAGASRAARWRANRAFGRAKAKAKEQAQLRKGWQPQPQRR